MRKKFITLGKASKGGPLAIAKHMGKGFKLAHLAPEAPSISNYTTGEVMGHSSDRLSAKFGVSRASQDAFALRSHMNAAKAHADGLYKDEIVAVDGNVSENCYKADSTLEKLTSLKPAFVKPHGTHTAGNSSPLTDGASACLVMSEEKALALGYTPKAYINGYAWVGCDPFEELLLGPAYATAKVLKDQGLTLADIGVFEIHEAFAGQVLSNLTALGSDKWAKEALGGSDAVGEVPMDKVNTRGGSLSLGHPFGATGGRLVTTAANRMQDGEGKYALIAACADGGLAHSMILERYGDN